MLLTNIIFSAYCACTVCCGPNAANITAAGTRPRQSVTVAGPRSIPLGTTISAKFFGKNAPKTFVVEDRTARKWDGKRWDIFFKSHEAARQFGLRTGSVTIVSFPKPKPTTKK